MFSPEIPQRRPSDGTLAVILKPLKMKFIFRLLTILVFTFSLFSCDPGHDIDFVNGTESNVKIKINLNPNNRCQSLTELSKGDSIVFDLKPKDTANIYCGMGTWDDDDIKITANCIKNIEVETKDIKTIYKSCKSIAEILKDNRNGFWWKINIQIEVE